MRYRAIFKCDSLQLLYEMKETLLLYFGPLFLMAKAKQNERNLLHV